MEETMRKKVRKGCANVIANAVRQIALTSLDSLRPVAIRVGNHCDVISAGDSVLEDMVQIITNLNSLNFVSKSAGEIVEFRTVVKETLKASDLKGKSFEAVLPGEKDVEILHVLNDEIEVVVYFRNTCGVGTKDDNLYALAKAGVDTDKLVVVNSRHTDISKFAYTISEDTDELTDVIDFQIESKISNSLDFNFNFDCYTKNNLVLHYKFLKKGDGESDYFTRSHTDWSIKICSTIYFPRQLSRTCGKSNRVQSNERG